MKIGYFADGPWSHRAIEKIVATEGLEVVFVVPRYDTQDEILKGWANKLDVPYIPHPNVNSAEFLKLISSFDADLFVSMSFNQILRKEIIHFAPEGFINCHAGALPFYRGRNPLNWVLINGEESFGITVHYVDEGIDTGDIIKQQMLPITDRDNYGTLLEVAISECANVLHSAILSIKNGNVERIKQSTIHPVGTYFGVRTFGDENVDFSWSAKRIFNFVRAISSPGPGARFLVGNVEYAIESCELIVDAPTYISTIGEVVGKSDNGVTVKVGDSILLLTGIREISPEATKVIIPRFRIGTRLTSKG